jgi:copper resistance protein B
MTLLRALGLAVALGCGLCTPAAAQALTPEPQSAPAGQSADPHAGHQQATPSPPRELPPFIPPITDEDRRAAFPEVHGHAAHDRVFHSFVLFDQLEWQAQDGGALNVDSSGWFGGDRNRLWFRVEGERGEADGAGRGQLLYGHQFARWWDVVAGFRQDIGGGNPQSWVGVGLQGLAPYFFEVEASAYASVDGQLEAWFEVEYALLVTNRWTLEPRIETHFLRADPERHGGDGLSTADIGLRLRYQIRREFAPYVGLTWQKAWADRRRVAPDAAARLVAGVRLWF